MFDRIKNFFNDYSRDDDNDPIIAHANRIRNQLKNAPEVREKSNICSQFNIDSETFDDLYTAYRMTAERNGSEVDQEFDNFARELGALAESELNLAKSNEHQSVINRIKVRLFLDARNREQLAIPRNANGEATLCGIRFLDGLEGYFLSGYHDYESKTPGRGHSFNYALSARFTLARISIYVYDMNIENFSEKVDRNLLEKVFSREVSSLNGASITENETPMKLERKTTYLSEYWNEFLCAHFYNSELLKTNEFEGKIDKVSLLYLTRHQDKFLKFRGTFPSPDFKLSEMHKFVDSLGKYNWPS